MGRLTARIAGTRHRNFPGTPALVAHHGVVLNVERMVRGHDGALPSPTVPDILLATDDDHLHAEVDATLADGNTTIRRVRRGSDVLGAIRAKQPDLIILDLQIGNMGGMATCHALRLEESGGRLPHQNVLMLLDRDDDIFLARRAAADGWLIKPITGFHLRKAARTLLRGATYFEARHLPV